jgi:transcriptional regulator with XRE-family HTH domain
LTADELRTWMEVSGYSVRALAAKLGVATNTVQRWRSGDRPVPSFLSLALQQLPSLKYEREPWGAGYVKPMSLSGPVAIALIELQERWGGLTKQQVIVRALLAAKERGE